MPLEIIYSEEVQEKLNKFNNILIEYENALNVHISNKYPESSYFFDDDEIRDLKHNAFMEDEGRKMILHQMHRIMELSIPESITFSFNKE